MAGPSAGEKAPAFTLPDHTGKPRTLDEFLGHPLVLYFYPSDFTPGCTREACQFQENLAQFEDVGVQVVGISTDPPETHAKFRRAHGLSFPLLSDEQGEVVTAYGASGLLGTKRLTFLLDPDGTVRDRVSSLFPGKHIKQALAHAREVA